MKIKDLHKQFITKSLQRLRIHHLLACILASTALSGCSLTNTRIDAKDDQVFLPAFRIGMNLNDDKQPASELQSGHAFEIGMSRGNGNAAQTLTTGQDPVTFGNTTFTAPASLQHTYDLKFGDISWRMRKFFDDRALGIEVTAGFGYSMLDLSIASPTLTATDQLISRGPQAGFGLIWRLDQSSSVQARMGAFASTNNQGVNGLTRYELSYTKALLDNISLRLGYAAWDAYGQTPNYGSDFRLRATGPVFALNWDFTVNNRKIKTSRTE